MATDPRRDKQSCLSQPPPGGSAGMSVSSRRGRLAAVTAKPLTLRRVHTALGRLRRPRGDLGWGQEIGRANGRSPSSWPLSSPLPPSARRRFPCARTRFWHGKSGLEDAFHHSRKTLSQTFHIFSPRSPNDLRPRTPSNPQFRPLFWYGARKLEFRRNDAGISATFCQRHFCRRLGALLCLTIQKT